MRDIMSYGTSQLSLGVCRCRSCRCQQQGQLPPRTTFQGHLFTPLSSSHCGTATCGLPLHLVCVGNMAAETLSVQGLALRAVVPRGLVQNLC